MVFKSRSGNSEALQHSDKISQFSSADELVAFSQDFFAADFPNPERLGCPIPGTLRGLVRSSKAPSDQLRSHLFGCSECFSEYRDALLAFRAEAELSAHRGARIPFFVSLWRKPVRAYASALVLILLGLTAAYLWRGYRLKPDQIVAERKNQIGQTPDHRAGSNNSTAPASPTPEKPLEQFTGSERKQTDQANALPPQTRAGRELIAMSVDLGNYALTRGGALTGGEIAFPAARVRLTLKLPEGSGSGLYSVSVTGASGDTLETINARSQYGKSLKVILNLENLAAEHFRMRISRKGEPPIDVPISVGPVRKR